MAVTLAGLLCLSGCHGLGSGADRAGAAAIPQPPGVQAAPPDAHAHVAVPAPPPGVAPGSAAGPLPASESFELPLPGAPEPAPDQPAPRTRVFEQVSSLLAERASRLSANERRGVAGAIADAHTEHGLDPLLVLAVITQESRFAARARGPRGSLGLMQVRPFVGEHWAGKAGVEWRGPTTLLNAESNVRIGVRYLAEMMVMFGDRPLALAAYNMGPSRLRSRLRRGIQPRARYSGRVEGHYRDLSRLSDSLAAGAPAAAAPDCNPDFQSC